MRIDRTISIVRMAAYLGGSLLLTGPLFAVQKNFPIAPGIACVSSSCHPKIIAKKFVHPGAKDPTSCVEICHHPAKPDLHEFPPQSPDLSSTCFECHDREKFQSAVPHPPAAAGECTACHDPHSSDRPRLFSRAFPVSFYASYSGASYALCLDCHSAAAFETPRTLGETGFRNGNLNLHFRHVNRRKGRVCTVCHGAHGAPGKKVVRNEFSFGEKNLFLRYEKTETGGKCTTECHEVAAYDRCDPEGNAMRTSPREGIDATPEALKAACSPKI